MPALNSITFLVVFLLCALGTDAEQVGCTKRVVHLTIAESQIGEIEQGTTEGHQPWRSNPYMVAEAALGQVETGLNPRTVDSIPYKRTILSPVHQLFKFDLIDSHHIDEISVRRLHWHNPRTGKTQLTGAWWATKAVISDCAIPHPK
jgi:hypothetical protein